MPADPGSRQRDDPPPLVSRVHAAQRQPLVWQSGLIKRAHLRSVTPFNLLHVKERISPACKPAQSQLAAPEIIARGAGVAYPLSPEPLWSRNWLVKLPFKEEMLHLYR